MEKMSLINRFTASAKTVRMPRALALTALFVGINITLDLLNIRIQITPQLRIGFGFLCNAAVGMLFGPVMGILAGFCTDVLGYLMNTGGGAYMPLFTITAMAGGLIYGLVLYYPPENRKLRIVRCFVAKGLINVICNMLMNTAWLSIMYGDSFAVLLPARAIKNLSLWPIESLVLFAVLEIVRKVSLQSSGYRSMTKGAN